MITCNRNFIRTLLGGCLVALLVAAICRFGFFVAGARMDEAVLLVYPEQMEKGKLPYRDFETFYTPANLWLLGAFYKVFGLNINVERAVGLLYRIALALGFFALARRWNLLLAILAGVLCAVVALPLQNIIAMAWLAAAACALWSVALSASPNEPEKKSGHWRIFLCGLLAGAALLFRLDLAPAVLLSWSILLYRQNWRARRWFAAGFSIALLVLLVTAAQAGFRNFIDNVFVYPVLRQSAGRRLPLVGPYFEDLILSLGLTATAGLSCLLCFRRSLADPAKWLIFAVFILIVGLAPQALQRADRGHVVLYACVAIPWAMVSIFAALSQRYPLIRRDLLSPAVCSAVIAVILLAQPYCLDFMVRPLRASFDPALSNGPLIAVNGRTFPIDHPGEARDVGRICTRLIESGSAGQRLFVGPHDLRRTNYNDSFFYYLLPQFAPATYFLEMNPLSANRPHSRLTNDIASADWVILDTSWDAWWEPNASRLNGSDEPMRLIADQFQLVSREGTYTLLKHKAPATSAAGMRALPLGRAPASRTSRLQPETL